MAKKKRVEPPQPDTRLIREFQVFGYDEGQFLPPEAGKSIQVVIEHITVLGIVSQTRLAMDAETAFVLSQKLAEVAFTLEPQRMVE